MFGKKRTAILNEVIKMNSYAIFPYVGVGDLRFGMSQEEAASILGNPDITEEDVDAELTTHYWRDNGLQLSFDALSHKLILISLYSNIQNIRMGDREFDWHRTSEMYRELLKQDPSARQTVGITIFFKYGISIVGFLSDDLGGKSLTVFAKGQWSPDDPALKLAR